MAGKMAKKNRKHQTLSLRSMPLEELAMFARINFDQGNLRIARDAYKELIRIDRPRFLPELLFCYNRMAQQMIDKQQINEAAMLIELIKELGGENAVTVRLDLAEKTDRAPDISMLSLESILTTGQVVTDELKFKAADWAVAKGEIPEGTDDTFKCHFHAIMAALAYLCARDFEQSTEELKKISFESPFSQWKLLIRGMSCYYRGDDNKAEMAFLKIVPDTVPSKIARAFLVLLNHSKYLTKTDSDREETVENACVLSGHEELKECLPRAHYFWMTNRFRDSLLHMQNNCASFPTLDQSIAGTLSNFYYNSVHTLKKKELSRYLPSLYNIDKNAQSANTFNKALLVTEFLAERSHGNFLLHSSDYPPDEIAKTWEQCYKCFRKLFGDDPFLEAEMYLLLATNFMMDTKELHTCGDLYDDPYTERYAQQSFALAETFLQKSIKLTKSKEAYILLMQLYRNSERESDCRVLIENATKDFPYDKDLLIEAGMMARSRKAYTKAVEYLERACKIDKLDAGLRRLLVSTITSCAKKTPRTKNGLTRMRTFLARAEQLCTSGSQGFLDDPVYIKIRRAALEFLHGNESDGNCVLQQVYASPIDPLKLDFFSLFVFKTYGVPPRYYSKLYSSIQMILFAPAKIDKAMAIIQVVSFARILEGAAMLREDFNRIFSYVAEAFKKKTFSSHDVKVCYTLAEEMSYESTCQTIVKCALKVSPEHPLYRFYQYKLGKKPADSHNIGKIRSGKKLLETLLADALTAHDLETAALIRKELESLSHQEKNAIHSPFPFDPSRGAGFGDMPDIYNAIFGSDFDDDDDCDGDCENCDLCDDDDYSPPKRKRPARRKKIKQKK